MSRPIYALPRFRFRTAVGVPSPKESFPLCGFVEGDLIAFSVSFGLHESVTAWAGQHTIVDGRERIETLWHLARNIADEDEPRALWSAILSGADSFELLFHAGAYLDSVGTPGETPRFLDLIPIRFGIADPGEHYHVPLLLAPYSYSTYRGS